MAKKDDMDHIRSILGHAASRDPGFTIPRGPNRDPGFTKPAGPNRDPGFNRPNGLKPLPPMKKGK